MKTKLGALIQLSRLLKFTLRARDSLISNVVIIVKHAGSQSQKPFYRSENFALLSRRG